VDANFIYWPVPAPVQSNYSGVLSIAGSLGFFGESSGGFAAVDVGTGKYLWHFETNHAMKLLQ
jgi:outer membrane protein assembly factor BamB